MPQRFLKNDGMAERKIGGERILVPIRRDVAQLDSLYTLNETASFLFDLAVQGLSDEDMAGRLAEEYKVTPADALKDVRRILDDLVSIGALKPA